jgi:surface antigen
MTYHRRTVLALLACALAAAPLAGCQTAQNMEQNPKATVGAVGGAVLGGVLGSKVGGGSGQLWATGAGAVLGGLLGREIGASLDRADMAYANQANLAAQTAPIGQTITWANPESGNSGVVTPTREGRSAAGAYCREFQQEITVGGRTERGYGTACQRPDGSWEIVQ